MGATGVMSEQVRFLDLPNRERLAVRLVLVMYGALVAQDQRIPRLGPRMIPSYLAYCLALFCILTLIDRLATPWQRTALRVGVICGCAFLGAAMGHTNPNSRGAIFLGVAAGFDQGWDFGLRLAARWKILAVCLIIGTANSVARDAYGMSLALGQFLLTGYSVVAYVVSRQRRHEYDRTVANHEEQLAFLGAYSFALGQQKSDLAFHDLKTIAQVMMTAGSKTARLVFEREEDLTVTTHVPQLGIVPLAEIVGPVVDPPDAWAFPITPHRRERIQEALEAHRSIPIVRILNYANLVDDPRINMSMAFGDSHIDVGPPVDTKTFRLEPDVFVFLFASFWFATEVFVPLPTWLRVVQFIGVVLCLLAASETQRRGIDNAVKARKAFLTLATLEFSWIGLRLIHSIHAPAFPPSVAVSALLVGIARCSLFASTKRDRAMFVATGVATFLLMRSTEWAWWSAIGQIEFGTAVSSALITYFVSQGTRRQRNTHGSWHEARLKQNSEGALVQGQSAQNGKWREIVARLRMGTAELEPKFAMAMQHRLNQAESLAS